MCWAVARRIVAHHGLGPAQSIQLPCTTVRTCHNQPVRGPCCATGVASLVHSVIARAPKAAARTALARLGRLRTLEQLIMVPATVPTLRVESLQGVGAGARALLLVRRERCSGFHLLLL